MVDDHSQRPYRSNEPPARGQPAKAPGTGLSSGSDPLAELARLIGQSDPFSEFGRDGVRRVAAPRPPEPAHDWDAHPGGAGYEPTPGSHEPGPNGGGNDYYDAAPAAQPQNFGRQQFSGARLASGADLYQAENEVPGYPPAHHAGYEDDRYNQNNPHLAAEEEDFYDDEPPTRRRMGILVIAVVFALAVIGTAGAFGYRALFGSSSSSLPPPVIKADSAPSKIVPAANMASQSSKQITDRINDRGLGEKLVSREEQPLALSSDQSGSTSAPLGSGIVGSEPKKVRTIAIRPDQPITADATLASAPPSARVTATKPAAPAQPPRVVSNPPPAANEPEPAPAPRPAAARAAPPVQQAAAPAASNNAPLSLSPDAPARAAPVRAAAAPAQVAPAAASSGGSGYAVQVSAQRSEAEAQAAFRSLQGKYPSQLGGKQPVISRVDLGEKGVYYRAMVGPFGNSSDAGELCSSLKAAGGSCIVQRN